MLKQDNTLIAKKLIDTFSESAHALYNYKQLAAKVGIFDKEGRAQVQEVIQDFIDKKILLHAGRGKYRINSKYLNREHTSHNYVIGKLHVTMSGAAFVLPEEGETDDIFIADGNLSNALHNDRVKARVFPIARRKGLEGEIVEVVERSKKQLVGNIKIKKSVAYFLPDNPAFRREILIPGRLLGGARDGEKVVIVITDWKAGTRSPLGEVLHRLGKPGDNNVEMNAILAEYDFPLSFPPEAEAAAAKSDIPISKQEISCRKDFRGVPTFTIDPADAKDFDDALSCEVIENGYIRVGVHIADVSYYVRPGTPVDEEASRRGTSVYLVDRTIPMLPEILSNNLCSLKPHEDKLCYSAVFDLDEHGKVHREWFGRTVIHSNRRFSYEEAQEVIETGKGDMCESILTLHRLAQIMRAERLEKQAINFETEEVKFHLDENGHPTGVYVKVEKESNFLIEEFMLLANRKVAEKIGKKSARNPQPRTFLYRVHDEPVSDKVDTFRKFVQKLGFDLKTGSRKVLAKSFNQLFSTMKSRPEHDMLTKLSIRLMSKAVYSTQNIGHYGLGFSYYTHFTSPIRRYPDLMVHRLLDHYLHGGASANADDLETRCKYASQMEQRANEAERASIRYKQAEFLTDKIGQVFEATVNGITRWGVFAELQDNKCEGLIPIRKFDDDFYYIDEENYTLVGLHHGRMIRFGDKIRVKVVEVDMLKKQMTFDIVS